MKKLMNEMIDDEAELGSDNEENDDKVKQLGNEDERKEAGLGDDEDLDDELKELINNVVEFNEEDEQLAVNKYLRDLAKKDKEEIRKIIEGAYKGTRANKRNLSDLLDAEGDTSEAKKLKRMQDAIITLQGENGEDQYSDEEEDNNLFDPFDIEFKQQKSKSRNNKEYIDKEKEQIQIREAQILLKKEYEKAIGQVQFDEKKLIDPSLLNLYQKKQVPSLGNSAIGNNENNNKYGLSSKKIIPTKTSDKVGVTKGNLPLSNKQINDQQSKLIQQQNGFNLNNLRPSNVKNSILHVKNNKNRFSQFNNNFNKDSLINEFGESALDKAFQTYADHSQNIFYSKQSNEDSNSRPIEKNNNIKLTKQSSSHKPLTGSFSSTNNQKSSLNQLYKAQTVISSGPSPNQLIIFGRKRASCTNQEQKQ